MTLRRIAPLSECMTAHGCPDLGPRPKLVWVKPTDILVDEQYQRDMETRRSLALIGRIVKQFAWSKYKPPICVEVDQGYHCINGQHTATAAATLKIAEIPIFVVLAETLHERADAFVAHNRDQVALTPIHIFRARVAAGDELALDVKNVCARAGVKVVQNTQNPKVAECASISKLQYLVKRQGVVRARQILEVLVKGQRAPISSHEIDAMEAVFLHKRDIGPQQLMEKMIIVVRSLGDFGVMQARMEAMQQEKPIKHVLFHKYIASLEHQTKVGVRHAVAN
jgi:hypothetical protein